MKFLCHRGYWTDPRDKNSWSALTQALKRGFGIETDIRDLDGRLVVSHDPPSSKNAIEVGDLLAFYANLPHSPMLALNIKSDGLQTELGRLLLEHDIQRYFVFDMSIPDTLGYRKKEMQFAVRLSEFETENALYQNAQWVWLDGFNREWFTVDKIKELLSDDKSVAIVSPELHGRQHRNFWHSIREFSGSEELYLCTDYLDEAMEFFDGR